MVKNFIFSDFSINIKRMLFLFFRCLLWSGIYLFSVLVFITGVPLSWGLLATFLLLMGLYLGSGWLICRLFMGRGKCRERILADIITLTVAFGINIFSAPFHTRIMVPLERGVRNVMSSYIRDRVTHFTTDELRWIRWEEAFGDTILFRSGSGKIDSMVVTGIRFNEMPKGDAVRNKNEPYADHANITILFDDNPSFFNSVTPDFYKAHGICGFKIIHNGGNLSGVVSMTKERKSKLIFSGILENEGEKGGWHLAEGEYLTMKTPADITEKDNLIDTSVIFKQDRQNNQEKAVNKGNQVTCFIVSKQHGLEYYKFEDGEEFTRIPD